MGVMYFQVVSILVLLIFGWWLLKIRKSCRQRVALFYDEKKLLRVSSPKPPKVEIAKGERFPRIIHQTWKTHDLPHPFSQSHQTWRSLHREDDWQLCVWSDEENEQLVKEHFPWFLETYIGFPKMIHRVDAVRACYLYQYGGLYVDMDFLALKCHESLFRGLEAAGGGVVLGEMQKNHPQGVPNAWMLSEPRCDFWLHFLRQIQDRASDASHLPVEMVAGPGALLEAVKTYPVSSEIRLVDGQIMYPINWIRRDSRCAIEAPSTVLAEKWPRSYALTYWSGSWK